MQETEIGNGVHGGNRNKFLISVSGGETQLEMKTVNELEKGEGMG